jgi:hypothetical protein
VTGLDGALYAYSDYVYLISDPVTMARALATALGIYGKVGLVICNRYPPQQQ